MSDIPRQVERKLHELTRVQRGFDSTYPLPWYHASGPEELSAHDRVQMMFTIIADTAGFASTLLELGDIKDESDAAKLGASGRGD